MNKTFKIVKNSLGQYVVAGEFAKSKSRSQTATKALLLSALSALSLSSYASIVRDDVDYQEFRNFAENKGKYQVGAVNIPVYDKSGKYLGTALPTGVPMPDFSVANSQTAVATLINTQGYGDRYSSNGEVINSAQYVGTVAHNTNDILSNLTFGDELRKYQPVNYYRTDDLWLDDNADYDESLNASHDFATPKLSKMVTSVAASDAIADTQIAPVISGVIDHVNIKDLRTVYSSDYLAITRLGSGRQYILDSDNDKTVLKSGAYRYLTGGSPMLPMRMNDDLINAHSPQSGNYLTAYDYVLHGITTTNEKGSPLVALNLAGDSGSPLFAYNKNTQRWELFAFVQGGTGCEAGQSSGDCYTSNQSILKTMSVFDKSYLDKIIDNYQITRLTNQYGNGGEFDWEDNHDGTSSFRLSNRDTEIGRLNIADYHLKNGDDDKGAAALDHGRDLYLGDGVTLKLTNYIDQGAGGIYLREGTATVKSAAGQAWVGSGVWVGEGATLNWAVMQPDARELERTDDSPYDVMSKLGKGTLHVHGGEYRNMGEISVGEGTVLLDKAPRYEGSDDFAFSKVTLTSGRGTVKLMQNNQVKDDAFAFGFKGGKLDLNGHNLNAHVYNFDDGAHILNSNESTASNWHISRNRHGGFHGFIGNKDNSTNGKINVDITSTVNSARNYVLSGGANTQGYLKTDRINLYLQGKNTPYADTFKENGAYSENYADTDWTNRDYSFKEINAVNRSTINVGRNVTSFSADTMTAIQSTINLGATKSNSNLIAIPGGGNIRPMTINFDTISPTLPTTVGNVGNIILANNSKLNVSKFTLTSAINTDDTSPVTLQKDATWNMNADSRVANLTQESNSSLNLLNGQLTAKIETAQGSTAQTKVGANAIWQLLGDSTVGNLNLEQGAKVLLNSENEFNLFNTLTIYDTLSGNGEFVFNTDLANLKGNKVKVLNLKGEHVIDVVNSGEEVSRADLVLFELGSGKQEGTLKLKNDYVHAGAYRYTLSDLVANTFKLQDTTPKPDEPVTPVNPDPVQPVNPDPVQPVNPDPVQPVNPDPVQPVNPDPVQPVNPDPVQPVNPDPVQPVNPDPVQPVNPDPVQPVNPDPVQPVNPDPVQPVNPDPVQPVNPDPVQPVNPDPVQPVNPDPVQPVNPDPVQPVNPDPVQPVNPDPVQPVNPDPIQPVNPDPVQPVNPDPVQPVNPDPVQPVNPDPVQPVNPDPVQPVNPDPVQPVNPDPVQPVNPEPVQPTTPEPVKPQNQVISKYTNAVLSDAIAAEEAVLDAGSGIAQHIGGTTLTYDRQFNVWTGFSAQNADYSSSQYRDFKRQHRQTQLGVDMLTLPNVQMGLALTQAKNTNEFAEARGKNDLLMGNMYAKYLADNGAFIALDVGVGELKNEVSIAEKAKFSRNVVQVGVTAGKAFDFGQFEVKPQAGVRYSRLSSASYNLDGANINVEATKLTTAFVGVETGYKFNLGAISVKPMISANYAVNKGEHTISVNGNNFTYDSDNQQNYRAGVEVKYRLATFSLNGGITKGNQLGTQRVVNAGLSFSF